MIAWLKKNKLLSILWIITFLTITIGLFLPAMLKKENKIEIKNNIKVLEKAVKEETYTQSNHTLILKNITNIGFIWSLGISIIGLPIILVHYITQIFLTTTESIFLFLTLKGKGTIFSLIYISTHIINSFIYFILTYYAVHYSLFLIKVLFLKKKYNIQKTTTQYLKIGGICLILIGISSIIELYFLPELLKIFI